MKEKVCQSCEQFVVYDEFPKTCPFCSSTYWDKPRDERRLFQLQELFLKDRDYEILGQMFQVLKEYAKNMVKRRIKNNGGRGIEASALDGIGHETAYVLIEVYLRKPHFKIDDSFGGAMKKYLGRMMNPIDSHDHRSAFSIDETTEERPVSILEKPRQTLQRDWQEKLVTAPHEITEFNLYEAISRIDDKVFYHQGWAASMLYMIGLSCKLKDRRSARKLSHLETRYSRFQVLENMEKAELMLRTALVGEY